MEDQPEWQQTLRLDILTLIPEAQVEVAAGFDEAVRRIAAAAFDLVLIDLLLPRSSAEGGFPEALGQELARRVRADPRNRHAGLLIATAHSTPARARDAFHDAAADDFIDKYGYTSEALYAAVRGALRKGVLRRARDDAAREVRLEISLSTEQVISARIAGRSRAAFPCRSPLPISPREWTAQADALNLVLLGSDPEGWRDQARALGSDLFAYLFSNPEISAGLAAARSASRSSGELCLRVCGPAAVLGVPFELMRDGNAEALVFRHQMIRTVMPGTGAMSQRTSPFYRFVEEAADASTPVRAVVVGPDADDIPEAEEEARHIRAQFEAEFDRLGVECEVTALIGADATVANVTDVLSARETHLFHYAGHGCFHEALPEVSGLVLHGDTGPASLRASDLYLLCKDSKLQLVFLSSCLGARSAVNAGKGDFGGVFDALARADVPTVLGYRWVVGDDSALAMASEFYGWLFRTLSPSRALFQARAVIAMGDSGWDDETWLSPILMVQNP